MGLTAPEQFRSLYQAQIADQSVATSDSGTVTLLSGKSKHTLYVQRVVADITTSAVATWTVQDSASTPVVMAHLGPSPGRGQFVLADYGPQGRAITEGKDLNLSIGTAGMAGNLHVDAYRRQTATAVPGDL
ncbi:hypothetical protein LCGC14_0897290 [marine sediment metagenome]|uniref:Uncharacterized protein n=1 Tax=marine sediment metagenome TaxID=412755 RepID=A0A0F9S4A7_9ZZZZ